MAISHRNLKAFVQLAKSPTFADAANHLHLTQPALSSAIKKMEEELGGKLFTRTTRNLELTPEGQSLLPNALRLLRDWEDTFDDIQNLFAMEQGQLNVASMPSFAEAQLPDILSQYHKHFPNIRLRVQDVVMESVVNAVLQGNSEVGFTFEPQRKEGLDYKPLFDDEFVIVVNSNHPLARSKMLTWNACLDYPLVVMNRGSTVRVWVESILKMHGEPKIIAETGQLATLSRFVKSGLGISIMPSFCQPQIESLGLHTLQVINDPMIKSVGIIKHSRRGLSVAASTLWDFAITLYR